jgi:hypothetical protein
MILYSPRLILSQILFNKVKNRPVCSSDKNKNKIRFEIQNVHIFVNYTQMFEKAMCWDPEVKIMISKEWTETLRGTPEGKPW